MIKKFLLEPIPKISDIINIEEMKMKGKRHYLYTNDTEILEGIPDMITKVATTKKFTPASKKMNIVRVELTYLASGNIGRGRPNKYYAQPNFYIILNLGPNPRSIGINRGCFVIEPGDLLLTMNNNWEVLKTETAGANEKENTGMMIYKGNFVDP